MHENPIVISLTGLPGCGKGAAISIIQDYFGGPQNAVHCSSGKLLMDVCRQLDIAPSRENLQKLAESLEKAFGKGTISRAMERKLRAQSAEVVIWDGIRWETDVEVIRKFPNSKLIYVSAPAELRFERMKQRGEKAGEAEMTFEQFLLEDVGVTEIMIPEIAKQADMEVRNVGTLDDLRIKIGYLMRAHIQTAR